MRHRDRHVTYKGVREGMKKALRGNIERLLHSLDRQERSGGKRIKVVKGKYVKQILRLIMVILKWEMWKQNRVTCRIKD